MSLSTKVGVPATVALTLMVLLSIMPSLAAQAVEVEEAGNITVVRSKAIALQYMLNNSLRLNFNLSEQLKIQIEYLLSVNVSELTPQELWEFVRNANMILAEICERARNAIGKNLESYAHGFAVAIEARVRNIARHYNLSEDEVREVLTNITQSRNFKEMFESLKKLQKMLDEKQSQRFANALAEYLRNETAKALVKGEVQGLERAYKALDRVEEALNKLLERLKLTNASSNAIEAVEKAVEHIEMVKEIINNLKETLPRPEPGIVKERLNKTLEALVMKAKAKAYELLNELENLMKLAEKFNATELKEELTKLKELIELATAKLEDLRNASQILDDLATLKMKINAVIDRLTCLIEKLLEKFETWSSKLEDQVNRLNNTLHELKNRFRNAKGMMPEKVRGYIDSLLDTVASQINNLMTLKIEEMKNKLRARDFSDALTLSIDIEKTLAKICRDIEEIKELLKT